SANAAVWHLDRPVKRLVAPREQLGDAFFGTPGALLAVREKDLEAIEGLKPAVRVLWKMEYDRDRYFLVEADPERPPEAGRFKRGGQGRNSDESE
ncbi:MAG: hypothetical protein KIS92_26935, partial [Planctomycetota bacterium]|nr:hypothetical protein [Planctomycetota bacterium]